MAVTEAPRSPLTDIIERYVAERDTLSKKLLDACHPIGSLEHLLSDDFIGDDAERLHHARRYVEDLHRIVLGRGHIDWTAGKRSPHTNPDHAALVRAGIDPESTQERDRSVQCSTLGCERLTWNQAGGCDRDGHYIPPAAVRRLASLTGNAA